jgi:predicted metal-dependent RNase
MIVLEEYINHGILKDVPVYLDGMIWEATAIHTAHPEYLSNDLRDQIFHIGKNQFISEVFKKVTNQQQRTDIQESDEPCVILSTSGMLTGGNSVEYFKHICEDERNTIIFVEDSFIHRKSVSLQDEYEKSNIYFLAYGCNGGCGV